MTDFPKRHIANGGVLSSTLDPSNVFLHPVPPSVLSNGTASDADVIVYPLKLPEIEGARLTIDHPSHYQSESGLEVIDVIEKLNVGERSPTSGFNLGNCLKYILRAGRKGSYLEDLQKAQWYLNREVQKAKEREAHGKTPEGGGREF